MTFFYSHQDEIDTVRAEWDAEREKLSDAGYPIVRSLSACPVCHRPKGHGMLLDWGCWNDWGANKISADHILELIANAELKNQGDYRREQ